MYPTVDESYWYLTANGTHEVRGVQVHYSDASGGDTIYAHASLRAAWDNPNWVFISGGTIFLLK